MKKLTFTRTSWITCKKLTEEELDSLFKVHRWKGLDLKKAKATDDFFRSATFLSYRQYLELVRKRPYLSNQLQFLRLSWDKIIEWLIIITTKDVTVSPFKIIHTYTNNWNLIKTLHAVKGDYFFFDQNLSFGIENFMHSHLYLKPDGMVVAENKIIFLETDMGTETTKRLRAKFTCYMEILRQKNDHKYGSYSILFFTTTKKRINRLRCNGVFQEFESLGFIEYWINAIG